MAPLTLAERDALAKAIETAARLHKDQVDLSGKPYIWHPLRVMLAVEGVHAQMAAILHDVEEDCGGREVLRDIPFTIPPEVRVALDLLYHVKGTSYGPYLEALKPHPIARAVKLADMRDNLGRVGEIEDTKLAERLRRKYERAIAFLEADG